MDGKFERPLLSPYLDRTKQGREIAFLQNSYRYVSPGRRGSEGHTNSAPPSGSRWERAVYGGQTAVFILN